MIYCDMSILIAALTAEVHNRIARSWLLIQDRAALAFSHWTVTEFANTTTRKHRRGDLDAGYRAAAEHAWDRDFADVARGCGVIVHPTLP